MSSRSALPGLESQGCFPSVIGDGNPSTCLRAVGRLNVLISVKRREQQLESKQNFKAHLKSNSLTYQWIKCHYQFPFAPGSAMTSATVLLMHHQPVVSKQLLTISHAFSGLNQSSHENVLIKCISFRQNGAHVHLEFTYFGEEVSNVPLISILFKDFGHCFDHHRAGAGVP